MRQPMLNRLISQGRKAGLHTNEIYAALAAGRCNAPEAGKTDGNGYVTQVDAHGHPLCHPRTRR
jgi:hypothetical protein